VDHLAALNLRFEENEQLRREHAIAHATTCSEAIRLLTHAIAKVLAFLNATSGTSAAIDQAIDLINIRIEPFAEQLKARATRARKAKEKEKAMEEEQKEGSGEDGPPHEE
jgi:hypothetical protein